ncbi:restriction endonuclease subunit S [Pedomonas sp. V897]|uniref:restriction endonuclease subunit S n=1 Tax=Pedomonas sp. V897 TaxID=3446482 RepID=UPI003EE3D147
MARGREKAAVLNAPVEGPWELPEGWRWERLGNIATPSKGKYQPDPKSSLPFVGLDSIAPHSIRLEGVSQFSEMRSAANAFSAGQILYGRLRPYLNKVWLADRDGACSGEFIVLNCAADIEPAYLRWILHHSGFVSFASHAVTGDRPRIDFKTMSAYPVPVPPLETQRRIVARIDELFSELEDGETALTRAREDLEVYRKALLKAAVTGELTADWRAANPCTETGEQLLQRILAERRARWEADPKNKGKRYKEPAAPDTSDLPELPEGWTWASLGQLFPVFVGSTPSRKNPALWAGSIPWVSSGEVAFNNIYETRECISPLAIKGSNERILPPGTVMLGMIGEGKTRGQAAILRIAATHNQNCASIRVPDTPVPPEFVFNYLRHRYERTRTDGSGGNQPALNKERVQSICMPLPPREEMQQIVETITSLSAEADTTLAILARCGDAGARLRQSILAAAFKGELVQ